MFSDPDPASTALQRIESMRQGARTVDEYVTEFRTWQDRSQLNEQALTNYFCAGLDTGVLRAVLGFQTTPDTLKLWQDQAMQYDRRIRAFQIVRNRNATTPAWTARSQQTPQACPTQNLPSATRDPNAMDINANCTCRQVVCYNCRKEGHFARNCPTQTDPQRTARQNIRELTDDDFLKV